MRPLAYYPFNVNGESVYKDREFSNVSDMKYWIFSVILIRSGSLSDGKETPTG